MERPTSPAKQMNTSRRRAADSDAKLGETARNALKLLFESTPTPDKRKELLAALGNRTVTKKQRNSAAILKTTLFHEVLALSFNKHGKPADSTQNILSELLQGGGESTDTPYRLQDLLALGSDGQSILHVILDPNTYQEEPFDFERLKPLIRFLITLHPGLPTVTDSTTRTPLFLALSETETESEDQAWSQEAKQKIVSYMCEASSDGLKSPSAIDSLRVVCGDNPAAPRLARCHAVHVAIETGVSLHEEVVKQLSLLLAKKDRGDSKACCLEVPDGKGRSCLHIALTSPFSANKIAWARILAKLQPQLLKSTYTSGTGSRKTSLTPLQHFSEQRNKDKERKEARGKTSKETDSMNAKLDGLEDFLKQQCLATFDNATCKSIMYTRSNVREISLAFEGEDPVSGESLKRLSQHYKLDTTLRTVLIPSKVSITWDAENKVALEQVSSWDCFGRNDLYMIFHWLKNRNTLPVKKVFEVMVDDFGDEETLPHSDKAIVESLKGLQVEIWDWARLDIPTEVIYQAAGDHVKTIYLYCSGLKVVLEAWADRNGLARLKNLEKVYLETNQGLESMATMKAYVEKFEKDLQRTFEEVNKRKLVEIHCEAVKPAKRRDSGIASAASKLKGESEQGFAEQDLLKCMDQFADIIEMLEKDKKEMTPIKVALIDDGVKSSYATLDDSIERGDSWVHQPNPSSRRSKHGYSQNYNTSAHGHGTVMAYYICRMCPGARLYVAKLNPEPKHGESSGRATVSFSIESTVEAIKWAVAEKVDIISMSWAIDEKELDYQAKSMGALRDAIKLAADNNILLFCANPDKGAGYPDNKSYPKQLDTSRVFCIGAATQDGTRWDKIDGGDASCDYFLPGVELGFPVESSGARRVGEPPTVWETYNGSSLSCALAAGLAAMILHCAQVSGKNATEAEYTWLKSHGGMRNAFNSIHVTLNKWLPVRRVFGHASLVGATNMEATMKALREEVVARFFTNMPRNQIGPEQAPWKLRTRTTMREDEPQSPA